MSGIPRRYDLGRDIAGAGARLHNAAIFYANRQLGEIERLHYVGEPGQPAFEDGWSNVGGAEERAAFFRDAENWVRLLGVVRNPAAATQSTIFTLPPEYAPPAHAVHHGVRRAGALIASARIYFFSDGRVAVEEGTNYDWLSLDGHHFWVPPS